VLRDALESCAAEEAARHITQQQVERLDSIVDQMEKIHGEIAGCPDRHATAGLLHCWLDCEEEFHEVLVEAARNSLLTKVVRDYRAVNQIFDAQRNDPQILTSDVAGVTCCDRRRLLQALRDRDAVLSRHLISTQIQLGRKTVLHHFRQSRLRRDSD
jgi:DNA-binding FadR family transcriptional regulator